MFLYFLLSWLAILLERMLELFARGVGHTFKRRIQDAMLPFKLDIIVSNTESPFRSSHAPNEKALKKGNMV